MVTYAKISPKVVNPRDIAGECKKKKKKRTTPSLVENRVDGVIALNILAETAKTNMAAMKVLHRLAQGVKTTEDLITPPLSSRSGHSGTAGHLSCVYKCTTLSFCVCVCVCVFVFFVCCMCFVRWTCIVKRKYCRWILSCMLACSTTHLTLSLQSKLS